MSNARSPRDVCSTTIGIKGISRSLLVAGGPQFLLRARALFLAGLPDALARLRELLRDRRHLGGDPVDRFLEPQIGADAVGAARLHELLDVLVALTVVAQVLPDLVVRYLDAELLGDRLEQELAADRLRRLLPEAALEVGTADAGRPQVRDRIDAAGVELPHERVQQVAGPHLDDERRRLDVRGPEELVDGRQP